MCIFVVLGGFAPSTLRLRSGSNPEFRRMGSTRPKEGTRSGSSPEPVEGLDSSRCAGLLPAGRQALGACRTVRPFSWYHQEGARSRPDQRSGRTIAPVLSSGHVANTVVSELRFWRAGSPSTRSSRGNSLGICFWRAGRTAIAPVLKTGARKGLQGRILCSPRTPHAFRENSRRRGAFELSMIHYPWIVDNWCYSSERVSGETPNPWRTSSYQNPSEHILTFAKRSCNFLSTLHIMATPAIRPLDLGPDPSSPL